MIGLVFALPLILVMIVFALSNAAPVTFGFWPTDLTVELPVSLAVLGVAAVFFLLGGFVVFIGSVSQRRRARRAESRVRALERELEALRSRPTIVAQPGTAVATIQG